MKQRIQKGSYLVVVLAMGLLLGACNKFLDRKPLSATLEDLNQGGLEGQGRRADLPTA